jgi:large repetitive protein
VPAAHAATLTIEWDPPVEGNVDGYIVHVGTAPGVYDEQHDVGNNLTFTFTAAVEGATYYFGIQAYNANGVGPMAPDLVAVEPSPALTNPGSQLTGVGSAVNLQIVAVDPTGQAITFSALGLPTGLSIAAGTGLITGTPTDLGVFGVTIGAADPDLHVTNRSFVWTIDAPGSSPPAVTIVSPGAGTTTTSIASLSANGTASDDAAVSHVTWSNSRGGSGEASGTTSWSATIPLLTGSNTITVTAYDAGGRTATATRTVVLDTPPTIAISAPTTLPAFTTSAASITLSGTTSDDLSVSRVEWLSDRGGSGTSSGTSSWTAADVPLQVGLNVIVAIAFDSGGNLKTATLMVTRTDTTPPTVAITSPTSNPNYATSLATLNIGGTATDAGGVTEVTWANDRGGSGTATGTTSWSTTVPLATGTNVITVTARDAAGNTSQATLTVNRDVTAPLLVITSPTIGMSGRHTTTAASVRLDGTASDTGGLSQVTWSNDRGGSGTATLTGNTWTVLSLPLERGDNVLTVTAQDLAGNTTTRTMQVRSGDFSAPSAWISQPTQASTYATTATSLTLSGKASDNVGVTQLTWTNDRGGSGVPVYSPDDWTVSSVPLQPGVNVITITASDAAGYTTSDTLTVTQGDTIAPTVTITAPTTAATYGSTATSIALAGTANDNIGVTQVTWSNDRGGSGIPVSTTNWTIPSVALQTGVNVISVTARDAAGNTATKTLTVTHSSDATPPSVAISSPAGVGTHYLSSANLSLAGTAADNVGVTQVRWSTNRGASGTATGTSSWTANLVVLQGLTVVTVTAYDAMGLTGSTTLTVAFDTTGPTVTITAPTTASTYGTPATSIALAGTANDNVGVTQLTWSNDRGGSGVPVSTTNWTIPSVALQTGVNVISITARDGSGNTTTKTLSITHSSDATPPSVAISSPAAVGTHYMSSGNLSLAGTAADNVGVTEVRWSTNRGASGTATGTSSWTANLVVPQGQTIVTVTAYDATFNTGTATLIVVFDTAAPTVTITGPSNTGSFVTSSSKVTFTGTANDNVGVTQLTWSNSRGGSGVPVATTNWSIPQLALQPGVNVITLTARDGSGNTSTASITVTAAADLTPPVVVITSPTTAASYQAGATSIALAGTANDNQGVTGLTWANDRGGSGVPISHTNWTIPLVALQPGLNIITVTARDAVGNTSSATLNVTLDGTAPVIAIHTPTTSGAHTTTSPTIALAGTANDNVGVTGLTWANDRGGNGIPVSHTNWSIPSVGLQPGVNVITVTGRDVIGNLGTAQISVTYNPAP